jgi:hypothetical protein
LIQKDERMTDGIQFKAAFPAIQSAIRVDGSGGGMRIQLDIPESEMAQAAYLLAMREVVLDVTIRPADDERKQRKSKNSAKY